MSQDLERLIMIVKKLRAPDGCEWDNTQTSKSLTPYLLDHIKLMAKNQIKDEN